MINNQINKPHTYSLLKKKIIKKIFVFKRKLQIFFSKINFAEKTSTQKLNYSVFEHKSVLLRPLKDVQMYLQHNKIKNLELAYSNFSGLLIKPDETFSFWHLVGKPTKIKGYLNGLILTNGKISEDVGGGLCQLSNLIYWIVLHSPLKVTERWRHSYDVFPDVKRKLPFGSGATLSYNYVDLQFYNPTKKIFQLIIWHDKKYLRGKLLSDKKLECKYEIYETDHKIVRQYWGGYTRHNKIWKRIIFKNGKEKNELVAQNHAIMMYEPMLEVHK